MIIKWKEFHGVRKFSEIKPGEVFKDTGNLYMKTQCGGEAIPYNSVRLSNGTLIGFEDNRVVTIMNAQLYVYGEKYGQYD